MLPFYLTILLGIIAGVTEFLPISSTAHLILLGKLFNIPAFNLDVLIFILQIVLFPVIIWYFKRKIWEILLLINTSKLVQHFFLKVALSCLPILCLAALVPRSFLATSISLNFILGGVGMILTERFYTYKKPLFTNMLHLSYKKALFIGGLHSLAIFPGVSRLAITLIGGRIAGLSRAAAVDFSFFIYMPLFVGEVSYYLIKIKSSATLSISRGDLITLFISAAVSVLIASCSINKCLKYLKKNGMEVFGYYRIILGFILMYLL